LSAGRQGIYDSNSFVIGYDDGGKYGERVTMSFLGLSMLDILLVLVFGKEKREALELVFSEGREEDVPGRFFKRPEIAKRTLLITDQEV
jgi:6-phosphogluconolactonase/glucosamine-6-phosphate isomerase/deaminase